MCHRTQETVIMSVAKSRAPYGIIFCVDEKDSAIICSPQQEFYVTTREKCVPASQLVVGDRVGAKDNQSKTITCRQVLTYEIKVYQLCVEALIHFLLASRDY